VHIDADRLAREAVAPGSAGLAGIRRRFGEDVIDERGELLRTELGARVFGDSEALADLNAIVHPEVRRIAQSRIAEAEARDPDAIVVYDVPLLVEAGVAMPWDMVVVAQAPEETRIRRLIDLRGMTREEAERRIAQQASDEARLAVADAVIDTSGSEAETLRQADELWERISTG